jgi:hypothetical protein
MSSENKNKEIIGFLFDLVLFAVPIVIPMPVSVRWAIWLLCLMTTVFLVAELFRSTWSRKRKIMVTVGCGLIFSLVCWSTAYAQWREEKSAAMDGYLRAQNYGFLSPREAPRVRIGDGGTVFQWTGPLTGDMFQNT